MLFDSEQGNGRRFPDIGGRLDLCGKIMIFLVPFPELCDRTVPLRYNILWGLFSASMFRCTAQVSGRLESRRDLLYRC